MRVLIIGATGLIGATLVSRLLQTGHQVVAVARGTGRAQHSLPDARWLALDMTAMTGIRDWLPHLAGMDAVVNCAGVLQRPARFDARRACRSHRCPVRRLRTHRPAPSRPYIGNRRRSAHRDRVFANKARRRQQADATQCGLGDLAPLSCPRPRRLWRQCAVSRPRCSADRSGHARYWPLAGRAA